MTIRSIIRYAICICTLTLYSCIFSEYKGKQGKICLITNQSSKYKIVLPANASDVEIYAAEELKSFIFKISGAELPIIRDDVNISQYEIILGENTHLNELSSNIDLDEYGKEGFHLITSGKHLIIAGRGRGVLYGVYTFLDKYLGCKWYTSEVSYIPEMKNVCLNDIDDMQVPVLDYREVYYYGAMDPEFAGRLMLNGNVSKVKDNRMASERHAGWGAWCHTSFKYLPPEKYFESHPEYYAFTDGKRQPKQICFSNPDIYDITVDVIDQYIDNGYRFVQNSRVPVKITDLPVWADQTLTYIDFSQQDHYGACDCESCKQLNENEGSRMGSILPLVNKLANRFPEKTISTLSYVWSRKPPKNIKPADNVAIMLCNFEGTRALPLTQSKFGQDKAFITDVERWSEISNKLFIWDYIVNFSHLYAPNPNFHIQQDNIKFYLANNATGIFAQGSREAGGEFCELRAYLLAKLLWNPDIDVDVIIDEFANGYYGNAGKYIRKYIDLMKESLLANNTKLGIYDHPNKFTDGFLSVEMCDQYSQIFDAAEKSVSNNPEILKRVKVARMPLMYVEIVNKYGSIRYRKELLEKFNSLCKDNNILKLAEGGNIPSEFYQKQSNLLEEELLKASEKKISSRILKAEYIKNGQVNIDGNLSEAIWEKSVKYDFFLGKDYSRSKLQESGEIQLAWDDEYLYVGVSFDDSDIVAEGKKDQLKHFELGDLCELFLKPADKSWYWELYVTPRGNKSTFFFPGRGRLGLPSNFKYKCDMKVASQCQGTLNNWKDVDKSWTAEMAVPLKSLEQAGYPLTPDTNWTILLARYNYSRYLDCQGPELSMTPQLSKTNYHLHSEYGQLQLVKSQAD